MPRVLITGIAGFVGSHLAEYLLDNTDWEVYGIARWNEPLDNFINVNGRINLLEGDLTDPVSIMRCVEQCRPDYVYHLAAQSYVQASFMYPRTTMEINVLGTMNLLDSLRAFVPKAWIHNCSSSEVYGRVPEDYGPIAEDCPFSPASPYSISKVSQDMIGRHYAEAYNMNIVTTRMFTHTGPRRGDVFAESSFAKQVAMIEAGLMEPPIKHGNLYSTRTIADVRDAVRAYHLLLTVNPIAGEVYNIGGQHVCQVGDILNALNVHDYPCEIEASRLRPVDANWQIPDYSKFKAHTGWEPEIPFEKTMADLLDYWRDRVKWAVTINR